MHARTVTEGGAYRGVHGAVRDLRERERLERDLRRQAADLAAAEERAHLARELHDSVTQALFSMTLVTRSIELLLDRDLDAARGRLGTLGELQKDALAEMRALIFELRPASLENEGLVQALRTHCAAVEGRLGLPIVIEADDEVERLPPDVEAALFRVAQEALTNIVKHAAAKHVHIALERTPTTARLTVEDDGVGVDVTSVPEGHLGLVGMRARAEKLGGTFDVASVPGRGTTIRVDIPLAVGVGSA
jgi:signal transduction histidine kinase